MNPSYELVLHLLNQIASFGVEEIVICAGARNSPFVQILSQDSGFKVFNFFEERSASFFALGRARRKCKPVAMITTSGSAVGELLPAAMEACYSGVPVVFITADRPRSLRFTGAPQTVNQVGIFRDFVESCVDIEYPEKPLIFWDQKKPLHINVCFNECQLPPPKVESMMFHHSPQPVSSYYKSNENECAYEKFIHFVSIIKNPLFIIGPMPFSQRENLLSFLKKLEAPYFAEAASGVREAKLPLKIYHSHRFKEVGGVIRIGGVPTLRFWRDLEESTLPVISLSHLPYPGLSHSEIWQIDYATFFTNHSPSTCWEAKDLKELLENDVRKMNRIEELIQELPHSEPAMVRKFSKLISDRGSLFLGNSLPIREWDLAASWEDRQIEIGVSRGVNGIDGQLSTFLGWAKAKSWGLFGDLTALYDLSAPWVFRELNDLKVQIAIMNNGGGKIFAPIFHQASFENRHDLNFRDWAKMWGLDYQLWEEIPDSFEAHRDVVLEIKPDLETTQRFWKLYAEK